MPKIVCNSRTARARLNLIDGIWSAICKIIDEESLPEDFGFLVNERYDSKIKLTLA